MKHILFVHASDELYGADRILLEIVRGLDPARFRATVALPNDVPHGGKLHRELVQLGVPVHRMQLAVLRRRYFGPVGVVLFLFRLVHSGARLAVLIQRRRVDVVHSHTSAVFSGALAARVARRPHLWHVSEIIVRPEIIRRALAWLLPRSADRIVTVSAAVRRHLVETEPRATAAMVIHNGIDPARFTRELTAERRAELRGQLGVPRDAVVVGMIGRVGSWKGQELLLDAAPRVAHAYPNVHFIFVGAAFADQEGHFARLRRLAEERSVGDRITIVDFRDDISELLQLIDVFVQPSLLPDPFPTSVLEAMSAAKPVIATAHGGLEEMIVHGVTGYLVTPGQPSVLADRIIELAKSPELARNMGLAGQDRVKSAFALESFRAAYAACYDDLLSRA